MAAGVKGQRPQLAWNRLQGDPGRHGPVACQRPVVLVSVRGGNATPGLLVQGLVVVEPDTLDLEQVGGDPGERPAKHKVPHHRALLPQVHHLKKRPIIGRALLKRQRLGVQGDRQTCDLASVVSEHLGRQHIPQMNEAVPAKGRQNTVINGIVAMDVGVGCRQIGHVGILQYEPCKRTGPDYRACSHKLTGFCTRRAGQAGWRNGVRPARPSLPDRDVPQTRAEAGLTPHRLSDDIGRRALAIQRNQLRETPSPSAAWAAFGGHTPSLDRQRPRVLRRSR